MSFVDPLASLFSNPAPWQLLTLAVFFVLLLRSQGPAVDTFRARHTRG
jgi:hypothetical protein